MWIAEAVPAHWAVKGLPEGGSTVYTVLRHRDRKAACKALGNYLRVVARRPTTLKRAGEPALYAAAGDLFSAAAAVPLGALPVLQVGAVVYRVRQEVEGEQPERS
jgi:hypothetical protein